MEKQHLVNTIIRARHSTFVNNLEPGAIIDDSTIVSILENAIWAPSHGLGQVWFFKVFAGKGVETFFKAQQKIYKETTPTEKFNQVKYDKFIAKADMLSHVIAVIARRDPKKRFPKLEDIVSTACALQNIYLSLDAYGVAGYLSTGDICYLKEMHDYLGLSEEDTCLGFFQLGKLKSDARIVERKRVPVDQKMEWVRE